MEWLSSHGPGEVGWVRAGPVVNWRSMTRGPARGEGYSALCTSQRSVCSLSTLTTAGNCGAGFRPQVTELCDASLCTSESGRTAPD